MTPEEKAKELDVPLIPKLPDSVANRPMDTNPVVAVCGQCGLEIRRIMGYSCSNSNCPIQPRIRRIR